MPAGAARPSGHDRVLLPVDLPEQPGEYKLSLAVVQEWVCWFSDRGSQPLVLSLLVE